MSVVSPQPPSGPAPPELLGSRYTLLRRLGRGGMAEVYLGHDRELDRDVAVKLLATPDDADSTTEHVELLRREARATAALNHPNVVAVHDIGSSDGTVFIVMEYLPGQSLAALLARRGSPLLPGAAARVAMEVASGLHAAHERGIIHRDIKPSNIMFGPDGTVKVLDFGIAQVAGARQNTATGHVRGTAAYLSPEQAQSRPLDARSDIYALGCCLYEMVTGQPPFRGINPVSVAYQQIHQAPTRPRLRRAALPARLEQVVERALARDPDERYPDAAQMTADLAGLSGTTPAVTGGSSEAVPPTTKLTSVLQPQPDDRAESPADPANPPSPPIDLPEPAADPAASRRQRLGLILVAIAVLTIVIVLGLAWHK